MRRVNLRCAMDIARATERRCHRAATYQELNSAQEGERWHSSYGYAARYVPNQG